MRKLVPFCLFLLWSIPAQATDVTEGRVVFPLPVSPPTRLEIERGMAGANAATPATFRGLLRVPTGAGKAPAVVLVHTCHGPSFYQHWLERLNDLGYVTLSFSRCSTPTGEPDDTAHSTFDWKRGATIAFGALQYLSALEEVDPSRIAIMGWSRPAMVPLAVLNYEGFSQFHDLQFRTAIAVYPFCSFARGPHRAPILIVSAGQDDYVDPVVCRRISTSTREDDYPIDFRVIEDAYHGFDIPKFGPRHAATRAEINPDEYSASGGTLEYRADYEAILASFVEDHLEKNMKP